MADDAGGAQVRRLTGEDAYRRAERILAEREGRDRPTLEILRLALGEFHRVTLAIQVDGALGWPAPATSVVVAPGIPLLEMRFIDGDLNGLQISRLLDLLGQNLDCVAGDGGLTIFCPSLVKLDEPDDAA